MAWHYAKVSAMNTTVFDGIALGKSRADTSASDIDLIISLLRECHFVPGIICEVGSYRCGVSICMAAVNPDRHVYAFDVFGGKPYEQQTSFQNFANADFDEIRKAIEPLENLHLVRGQHEMTIPRFPKGSPIAFLYMDSDFYSSHRIALDVFGPRISPGGCIVFHDYAFAEVKKAIADSLDPREWEGMRFENGPATNMFVLKRQET